MWYQARVRGGNSKDTFHKSETQGSGVAIDNEAVLGKDTLKKSEIQGGCVPDNSEAVLDKENN